MKNIIEVKVKVVKSDASTCKADMLAVGIFAGEKSLSGSAGQLDKKLNGALKKLISLGDFKAKEGETVVIYGGSAVNAERVMLVGLGENKKIEVETIRKAAAAAANKAVGLKAAKMCVWFSQPIGKKIDTETLGRAITEGLYFGAYRYDEFVTGDDNGRAKVLNCEICDSDDAAIKKLRTGLKIGEVIGKAQNFARTMANRPGNVINPTTLAAEAKKVARSAGLNFTVLAEKQLREKGMGGILAVGSGSRSAPKLIILKHKPKGKNAAKKPTIAIVGKAITFDSGGISIKPSSNMDQMKFDKSGGIAVLATMKIVAELGLDVNVTGYIPSAENMPSGNSYRPGDIVTTFSGKTVEIQNTDAEGRMVLCDAINYAVKQGADVVVDIATLTGACMVALGHYKAGLMSNDDALLKSLQKASEQSGEAVWHLPSGDEYADEMKSKIADLKNTGGRWGGASTAAAFLRQFVEDKKWAHIDMAGVDLFEKSTKYSAPGSSGFGVRLLTSFLMGL